jgi:hypothetical protein
MSNIGSQDESPFLVLLCGVLVISLLPVIAVLAMSMGRWVSVTVGAAELIVAWQLKTAKPARIIRWSVMAFGAVSILVGVGMVVGG